MGRARTGPTRSKAIRQGVAEAREHPSWPTRARSLASPAAQLVPTRRLNPDLPEGVPAGIRAETFDLSGVELVLFDIPLTLEAPSSFTAAERDVLNRLRDGLSSAEIARARGTSERTVANQLASMYRKTGVCSRQELLAALVRRDPT